MKPKKNRLRIKEAKLAARRKEREERLAAMRDGRKQTAHTFADKKRKANKNACRKGNW